MLKDTPLFDRIHAALLASAIGDAMGGPVEGWPYPRIIETHGVVDTLLPYDFAPDYHNHFATAPGSITDDTRLRHLLCRAIVARGARPRRGDLARAVVEAYHSATGELERGFLEEYALGAFYGESKLIWGGQPTNGFLMANAPLGLICPCDPVAAFALSFDVDFIGDGYARHTAALAAAAVAAALAPGARPATVIEAALAAGDAHRVEGPLTRAWPWYAHVFRLNERLIETAVAIAERERDVFAVRAPYYEALHVAALGSEAAQTLAVALGMLVAAGGDLRQTLVGCVNYGRDNDSIASVGGAIAGALHGTAAIPADWRATVEAANPAHDFAALAAGLAEIVQRQHRAAQAVAQQVEPLLEG